MTELQTLLNNIETANTTKQINYLVHEFYGGRVQYKIYGKLAQTIGGQYENYTLYDNNHEILTLPVTKKLISDFIAGREVVMQSYANNIKDAIKDTCGVQSANSLTIKVTTTEVTAQFKFQDADFEISTRGMNNLASAGMPMYFGKTTMAGYVKRDNDRNLNKLITKLQPQLTTL